MAYGTPLPNLDQALAQWNAAQGTPPPGAVPQYQLDSELMGPPVNPWADALAENTPPQAPMGMGSATPPEALADDANTRAGSLPDQEPTPLGGSAWSHSPQL